MEWLAAISEIKKQATPNTPMALAFAAFLGLAGLQLLMLNQLPASWDQTSSSSLDELLAITGSRCRAQAEKHP